MTENQLWIESLVSAKSQYEVLHKKLMDAVAVNSHLKGDLMREYAKLEALSLFADDALSLVNRKQEAEELKLSSDSELIELAKAELKEVELELKVLHNKYLELYENSQDSDDIDDNLGAIMEIRAGTGGDEAALFAADLWRMYQRYCEINKWKFQVISYSANNIEGCREGIASIQGKKIWQRLSFESGVHRVQRVPVTESSGRVHTSTASVIILPETKEIDVVIGDKDLRTETYRAQGAGGQHVNKTDSAVRITHLPTGIVAQCQDDKSQHRNRDRAMQVLRARIADKLTQDEENERTSKRKSLVNTGDRSERIRTYNFAQNRVSDHRVNISWHKLDKILDASALDEVIDYIKPILTKDLKK